MARKQARRTGRIESRGANRWLVRIFLGRDVRFYNEQRSHQGYRTQGRAPWRAFQDGVALMPTETAAA
jgi:hypothetical protein